MNKLPPQFAKLVAMLASDQDGEVLAAVAAIKRALVPLKMDFNDLGKLLTGAVATPMSPPQRPTGPRPGPSPSGASAEDFWEKAWQQTHGGYTYRNRETATQAAERKERERREHEFWEDQDRWRREHERQERERQFEAKRKREYWEAEPEVQWTMGTPRDHDMLSDLLALLHRMDERERTFVKDMKANRDHYSERWRLSVKQRAWLELLWFEYTDLGYNRGAKK